MCSERTPKHETSSWPWSRAERIRPHPPLPKHSDQPSSQMPRWPKGHLWFCPQNRHCCCVLLVCGVVTSVNPSLLFYVCVCVSGCGSSVVKTVKLSSTKPTKTCLHLFPVRSHLRSIKRAIEWPMKEVLFSREVLCVILKILTLWKTSIPLQKVRDTVVQWGHQVVILWYWIMITLLFTYMVLQGIWKITIVLPKKDSITVVPLSKMHGAAMVLNGYLIQIPW